MLALAPGTEQKGLLSALQAGEPSGQRSPTGVFVLPKASTFPSLTISLSLSLLCPPPPFRPSLPHAAPLLYGPIIFSLLHFLPLHFRICPSAQRQGSTLSLSSGAVFFPFFFSALVTQEKTFSREKKMLQRVTQTSLRQTEANFFAAFYPFVFVMCFFCSAFPLLQHLWAVSATLFYAAKRNPTKNISSNSRTKKKKKKTNLAVQEIREV